MVISREDEAAWTLVMMSHSLPMSTNQSVVAAKEREWRVFIKVPTKKRSSRTHRFRYSTAIVEYVPKEDHIHEGPLTESPTRPTRSRKKGPALFSPPMEQRPKKKAKRKNTGASSSGMIEPAPEWLVQLMRSKNVVEEPKKIIEKELTKTDVNSVQARLSMPVNEIIHEVKFLTPEEETVIQEHADKLRMKGVDAKLVCSESSDLRGFDVNLRRWTMGKISTYNLVTGWNKVVKDCRLEEGATIRVWSFHSNGDLYFALDITPPAPAPASDS